MGRSRLVRDAFEDDDIEDLASPVPDEFPPPGDEPSALRVQIIQSPVLNTFFNEHPFQLTLDTGATSNIILPLPRWPGNLIVLLPWTSLVRYTAPSGADLGGVDWVASHPPP